MLAECRQEPCTVDLHAMVATIAYAGLRKSEVLNMRWDWIDYRREQLTVRPSKEWHTKNYKPRTIPLTSALGHGNWRGNRSSGKKSQTGNTGLDAHNTDLLGHLLNSCFRCVSVCSTSHYPA